MHINQVEHFLTIVKHMSFTMAAKELYITQPALSNSIARLEKEIGVPLFYRSANKLSLTVGGMELLEDFRRIQEDVERLNEKATALKGKAPRNFLLGFAGSPVLFSYLFSTPSLSSYQDIPIQKLFFDAQHLTRMLRQGDIDLAISYPPIQDEEINSRILFEEEIGIACGDRHPLAVADHVYPQDLEAYGFIMTHGDTYFRKNCEELCQRNQIHLRVDCEYNLSQYNSIIDRSRHSPTFATLTIAGTFQQRFGEGFVFRQIEGVSFHRSVALSWRKNGRIEREHPGLITQIEEIYEAVYQSYARSLK